MPAIKLSLVRIVAGSIAALTVATACGPFFGLEVLTNRKRLLLAPPTASFAKELRSLAPAPQDRLPVVEQAITRESIDASSDATPAARFYKDGAAGFRNGQMEQARRSFLRVLALPEDQRKLRDVWAQFMLGRIAAQRGERSEAARRFEATRTLVRNGEPDPLGLAVASFGEEALLAWNVGDLERAVALYARQASYDSQSGATSLLILAGRMLKDANLLDRAVRDPTSRRLVFLAVNVNSSGGYYVGSEAERLPDSTLDRIADALKRNGIAQAPGVGLLASGAYHHGRFDLAERLCALDPSPATAWTAAKLALRKGDRQQALKLYARALSVVAQSGSGALRSEMAIVRVSRGDYVQALDLLYRAAQGNPEESGDVEGFTDYWGDVAYLGERVLTIRELQNLVDRSLSEQRSSPPKVVSERSRLRSLLARRLMRADRRREAFRYFDDPKVRAAAEQYDQALDTATGWLHFRKTKAEAWFTAAKLARTSGMEILSFERDPDYAMWGGEFGDGRPENAKEADPFSGSDERSRVAASSPKIDKRFHYRFIAADQAKRAADLLPTRSQAFAAALCESTLWIIDRDPAQARETYRRYIRHGAFMPWATAFGRSCPAPDFASATMSQTLARDWRLMTRHGKAHPWLVSSASLAVLASSFLMMRRSRRKAPMPNALGGD